MNETTLKVTPSLQSAKDDATRPSAVFLQGAVQETQVCQPGRGALAVPGTRAHALLGILADARSQAFRYVEEFRAGRGAE